jgi:fumarate reductase iron-sulfur subunit
MKIRIVRFDANKQPQQNEQEFEVSHSRLLDALHEIKTKQDNSLTFRQGCGSGVCGSCAVRVNGVERLACKTHINEHDLVEPIKYCKIIRDLVVDLSHQEKFLRTAKSFLQEYKANEITKKDEKAIAIQSNCILCQSCFSSCPVYEVNKDFLGPYVLTRVLRYVNDKKEKNIAEKLASIQSNGIWDCTLCGNCTMVCPQFIDPKTDILNLRTKSYQNGYTDPNLSMNSGFDVGFGNGDFGFNPNGF